jgi:NAD(P)H-hydrate repair Nnr-like enzyme with NAD(P)H-hydrate dehydratase domain
VKIQKLDTLKPWQLMLALLSLGVVTALLAWGLIWVIWTIRPFVAAAAALVVVGWLAALHRFRRGRDWKDQEWIGS